MSGKLDNKLSSLQITPLYDDDDEEDDTIIENTDTFDEYDDDDEEEDELPVTLGFVEKPINDWSLFRYMFPSKAGGVPAWLDPINLPSGKSCVCDFCGEPLQFLLQVYAPLTEKDSTFHRTLFVFMCPSMSCLLRDQHEQWKHNPQIASRSVKVFRCQLPRSNPFYSAEPPKHDGTDKALGVGAALCSWCATWKGDKVCGSCRRARYCSQKHQAIHWQKGHRVECRELHVTSQASDSGPSPGPANCSPEILKAATKTLWPHFEIVNEDESEFDAEISNIDKLDSTQLIDPISSANAPANSVLDSDEGDDDKKSWISFHRRITRAPEQVMRYSRDAGSKPLWPMSSGRPSTTNIPNCSFCGSHRRFEFQILPQLLYYFAVKNDVDSLDWATICVYTCEASCEGSLAYKDEFAWVQLVSQSTTGRR